MASLAARSGPLSVGRGGAEELAGVGTAEPHPGGHDVLDVRLKAGEGVPHHLETLPPRLAPCSEPSWRAGMSTSLTDFARWRRTRLRTAQLSPQ